MLTMHNRTEFDVIITGCGIAGASLAYFLTENGVSDILLLEREEQPGYHSTGRSAAVMAGLDPVPAVLRLKLMSTAFFRQPPAAFCENPLVEKTGVLAMYQGPMWESAQKLASFLKQSGEIIELLSPTEAADMVPAVSSKHLDGALYLPKNGMIDVHGLLWSYLRHARQRGAELRCNVEVRGFLFEHGRLCGVVTNAGEFHARKIVNAAGAWAGQVGRLAGAANIRLTPLRRTIVTFNAPEGFDVKGWPFVFDHTHEFYFGPESGGMLASPMDQEPVEPCDARPDELVVARTLDRIERFAPRLLPKSLRRTWAGLRTFTADQSYLIGEDPRVKGFFWLAGQGGTGIATSPAAGRIAADLLIRGATERIDASLFAPGRF